MPTKTSTSTVRLLHAKRMEREPWLVHGFSTRPGGVSKAYGRDDDLNLGFTKHDRHAAVEKNRARFLAALGARDWPIVTLRQTHSDLIHRVDRAPKQSPAGDGLVTRMPKLLLAIQTADCLPVLLADPEHHAVGAFHAGWRGTLARIVEKGIGRMRKEFGSDPAKLVAAIGPGVRVCCYRVGREVHDQFESQFAYADDLFQDVYDSDPVRERYPLLFLTARAPGHSEQIGPQLHLDLGAANRRQLETAGVPAKNITDTGLCTVCKQSLLFSYRASHGHTGRLLGTIGVRR
jgi:YfiH family protein